MLKYLEDIEKPSTFALAFGKELRANKKEEIFETLINNNKTVQKRAVNSDDGLRFLSTIKGWDINKRNYYNEEFDPGSG